MVFRTVAIDMRGYGDSDKPSRVSDYDTDLLIDDIKGIVTALGELVEEMCTARKTKHAKIFFF